VTFIQRFLFQRETTGLIKDKKVLKGCKFWKGESKKATMLYALGKDKASSSKTAYLEGTMIRIFESHTLTFCYFYFYIYAFESFSHRVVPFIYLHV
jgi:hypothetical protein